MLTVPSRARVFSIYSKPTGATNQRKMERPLLDPKKFSSGFFEEFHISFEQIFGYFFVCVTENKNLCKGTAVRFSQTRSTGQRKRIPEIDHFCEKNFTRTERIDGNFQTIRHNGKHSKYAFVIF